MTDFSRVFTLLVDDRPTLSFEARNKQLAEMTDEVGRLVLWDNYRQNQAITLMEHQSARRLGSMAHFIRTLEGEVLLDRQVTGGGVEHEPALQRRDILDDLFGCRVAPPH